MMENAIMKVTYNFHTDKIVMNRDIGLTGLNRQSLDNLWTET